MNAHSWDVLKTFLIREEGLTLEPYWDKTAGYATFGVGHNLEANPLTAKQRRLGLQRGFDRTFALMVFEDDLKEIDKAITDRFDWILDLPQHQQIALYEMIFQLGEGNFSAFEPTWEHLRRGELDEVRRHLENSRWYKQTPARASRVIKLLIEGK